MSAEALISESESGTSSPIIRDDSHYTAPITSGFGLSRASSSTLKSFGPLIGSTACFTLFSFILYSIVQNVSEIPSGISYMWCLVALILPLVGGVRFLVSFVRNSRGNADEDTDSATICSVEVCINNETVLTVRSWWPRRMNRAEVERHGVRVAMSSARRWLTDNSQPGGKITRIKFSEEAATDICRRYICSSDVGAHDHHSHSHDEEAHCSVCLDDIEAGHNCMKMKKCGHAFHQECLSTWIAQSGRLACLLCRADHFDLVPQSVINHHIVKEDPSVSVLTVAIEHGSLAAGGLQ